MGYQRTAGNTVSTLGDHPKRLGVSTVLTLAVVAVLALLSATRADASIAQIANFRAAEGVDLLDKCSQASDVVSLSDGSSVAFGVTDDCVTYATDRRSLLLKLNPSGELDTSFGNGGISLLPDAFDRNVIELMVQSDGKLLLVTRSSVSRFLADGSFDQGYGGGGIVPVGLTGSDSSSVSARAASLDSQGRVLVAGTANYTQPVIRRFLDDGTPDGTFGIGGMVQSGVRGFEVQGVGASSDGSVLVSGVGPQMIRLSATGDLDLSYGSGGVASFPSDYFNVRATRVDASGTSTIAAQTVQAQYGCFGLQIYRFDAQGTPTTGPSGYMPCEANAAVIVGEGAAIASNSDYGTRGVGGGHPYEFELRRIGDLGNGMTPGPTDTFIGFGDSVGFGVTAAADGSILLAGATPAGDCLVQNPCVSVMVIARYKGAAGGLDPSFGDHGVVLLPGITCPVRTYSDGPVSSDNRNRCLGDRPDTFIEYGPSGTIRTNDAYFRVGGIPDRDTDKIQCRIDDADFTDCGKSYVNFLDLADGPHTASFRAEDVAGNQDLTPATSTFKVDTTSVFYTTPPDTNIFSDPTAASGVIHTNRVTFNFSGNPAANTAKVQCRLDDAAFADCTSPATFTDLSDGPHTVSFRAEDAEGNQDQTPATRTFTVDTTVPATPKARIGVVTVSGPAKAKKGKKATYKVKITNSGNTGAAGVRLKVSGRGVSFDTSVGTIAAGKTKTVKVKFKPKQAVKIKATFKVTSSNAGGKTVKKTITVKK